MGKIGVNILKALWIVLGKFPNRRPVYRMRAWLFSKFPNKEIGKNVIFEKNVNFNKNCRIILKDGAHIADNVVISAGHPALSKGTLTVGISSVIAKRCVLDITDDLTIGDYTSIGRDNIIFTHKHHNDRRDMKLYDHDLSTAPVVIGNDAQTSIKVVILCGVTMHDGSIAALRAVVTKDVAPYTMVGGVPAKKISERK